MSGTSTSVSGGGVGAGVGYGYGFRPPFTAVQWQELEHQAMIYKYLVAGVPVPPDLVVPIRRSFDALSSRFFHQPTLGYCSYYGKKFDPEPGRCRRTDGKKWRCSKDAYPDSKYCERHMHRGRNRSRKPVESQAQSASQPFSTAMSHITSGSSGTSGSFQSTDRSFQNMPLYSIANSEGLCYGSSATATKLQMECASYGRDSKDFWYTHGMNPNADEHNFAPETSASVGSLGMGSNIDSTWPPVPFQASSSPMLKLKNESLLLGSSSSNVHLPGGGVYEPIADTTIPKQHCLFGSNINSPGTVKQEQQSMRPFFSEWPATKESWSNPDSDGSNKTQLSISIPTTTSDFSSRTQNDA